MRSEFPTPAPGSVIARRFTLQRTAGRGGMGLVFLASDEQTGLPVALKLLHAQGSTQLALRFAREARTLASLRHSGIVTYVDHGLTEEGQPFLAMEWLEGEDLGQRLDRAPLSPSESVELVRRVADALAVAHAQGIIHRDIKPSNLFLRGGQPRDVVLLDFGLAHLTAASQHLTNSNMVLGTPGYMAPEQASGSHGISPAADIFSLGCVLYECLAGRPPFLAPHMAAVLAKILFFDPPSLRTSKPRLPAALHALVEQMLAKQPGQRPANASHLLRTLNTLEIPLDLPPASEDTAGLELPAQGSTASMVPESAHAEQHLVSVLLATPRLAAKDEHTLSEKEEEQARQHLQQLLQSLQAYSAHATLLADGSLLATFFLERGSANDQAALAAHCALSVKERWPESLVALTTGLSVRGRSLPAGDAVDRAGELLRKTRPSPLAQVLVDDTTAGLLGTRFQTEKAPSGLLLLSSEHLSVDESRPLLGRPTPCVGREQELALLELALGNCVEDSCAHAVLVTAPAGVGKSRLRHELLRRLERHLRPPLLLLGRGDPMSASTPHGLVGQAVRRLCGVVDGEPLEARRAKLIQRLTRHTPSEHHADVTEFLGELCAISFPGEHSLRLRAAREDPHLMNTQITRALVTWLKAECSQCPVLLMLEDLHWGDGPSIHLMDQVLRELAEQPLLVLAFARPEVKELFPRLWAGRMQELPLRGLSQKASARLVRQVLGPELSASLEARLIEHAAGNALFLEELIRGAAEGHGEEPPGSVLAMLQARIQRMEPETRRVLLAASILGRTFWQRGVWALLEPAMPAEELSHCLRRLVELEVVQSQLDSRFPAEAEYRFHHALVRDAAYSLLPDSLRSAGHLRAGGWLEASGESEPLVLAEHYQLGKHRQKAIHFYIRACRQICERQRLDLQGAQRCLKAAYDCGPEEPALTELQELEADICFWMGDFTRSSSVSYETLPKLTEGSAPWIQVVGNLIYMHTQSGRHTEAIALGKQLLRVDPVPTEISHYIEGLCFHGSVYNLTGRRNEVATVLRRMEQVEALLPKRDGLAHGWVCVTRGYIAYIYESRFWRAKEVAEEGIAAFAEVGSDRNQLVLLAMLGEALAALGELPRAVQVMKAGLSGGRDGSGQVGAYLRIYLALVLSGSTESAHLEEARRIAFQVRETPGVNPLHPRMVPLVLSRVALAQGDFSAAQAYAREARERMTELIRYQLPLQACLSVALLGAGNILEARAEAERGVRMLEHIGGSSADSVSIWLALAEATQAQGDDAATNSALRQALRCLHLQAEDVPEGAARECFLSQVPRNARVLALSRQRAL
ncbi:MAG TPA: protein kinase [Myxococcaceae bacterium]|nr:protein kinase [Myxococcaceae bacterium]